MRLSSYRAASGARRPPQLLIAGASARAAAQSAANAGIPPATADRFADHDLAEIAQATRLADWPEDLVRWSEAFPPEIPFLYLGGLEIHPALLAAIGRRRPVAGITGPLLARLRDPRTLAELAAEIGMRSPRIFSEESRPAGRMLIKRFDSIAGIGIRFENGNETKSRPARGEYRQEFIAGTPISAAYLLSESGAELIGTARQLTRNDPRSGHPFQYAGSLTIPPPCPALVRLGSLLHARGVRGLAGADFILTEQNEPVLLEINPRYTASMELFEWQAGRSLIAEHLAAFGHLSAPRAPLSPPSPGYWGKKILFARRPLRWPESGAKFLEPLVEGSVQIADLPHGGEGIATGDPICTILAQAPSPQECLERLFDAERRLDSALM